MLKKQTTYLTHSSFLMSINWVYTISSNHSWPHIWISYFTHGNEPVGEKIMRFLIDEYLLHSKLISGSVSFVHINPVASKKNVRYIDHNMNRIRNKAFQSNSSEFARKEELIPFLKTIDILFDIHSTAKPSPCVLITDEQFLSEAKSFVNAEEIRIGNMKQQWALISFFTQQGKPWFGIEAGSHHDARWYQQGIRNLVNFLAYYWIIQEPVITMHYNKIYRFCNEIFCTQTPFRYAKEFIWICPILPWEIIAYDGENIIKNTSNKNNICFWLATNTPIIWGGAGFFFERVE